ncbi:MAG: hypothetical protein US39_C0016G0023 [Microgenomates group bacterium GW2011_GWC1_37_12b]|uniref:Fimbrial assembly family protein n=2 Tax=Candidatus Woeseibacteriota TaxID=1752722 RepID=A0A0G0L7P5_9BACT|nr:MAG: hypothetical protein US39_C0016G0023 [Microgenomates group bacterium GW2011_GWC1_37_12b]KKQ87022.1 MAG: hypothetical protein UT10_C0012G0010 [Candidatus Woesebacteria bacterium GW2011_GWB1_38_8b]
MADINLIPQTSKVSQEVTKKTNTLGSVLKLFIVLLFVSLFTSATVWGIIYYRLNQVKKEHEKLKTEVATLKKSESRFVLLRDRLEKISKIQSEYNISGELETVKDLSLNITSPSLIKSLKIDPNMVEVEVETDSSLNITKIFSQLIGSGKYNRVSMLSFDYNPATSYLVTLQIIK